MKMEYVPTICPYCSCGCGIYLVVKDGKIIASGSNEVVGNNEITELSVQFNYMIKELESYTNELEDKVRERTAEIRQQKEKIEAQRDTVVEQKGLIEKKNINITDSIKFFWLINYIYKINSISKCCKFCSRHFIFNSYSYICTFWSFSGK